MPGYEGLFTTAPAASEAADVLRAIPGRTAGTTRNPVIEIEYSRPLDPASIDSRSITLRESVTSRLVPSNILLRGDHTIRISPAEPLSPDSSYTYEVSAEVAELTGRPTTPIQQTFTTGTESIFEPPRLLSAAPSDGATEVDAHAEVQLTFDRALNPLTLSSDTVWLTQGGVRQAVSISLAKDGREVILATEVPLMASGQVQVTVTSVEDLSGNTAPYSTIRFQVGRASKVLAEKVRGKPRNSFAGGLFSAERRIIRFLIGRR